MKNTLSDVRLSLYPAVVRILCSVACIGFAPHYCTAQTLGPHQPEFSSFAPANQKNGRSLHRRS